MSPQVVVDADSAAATEFAALARDLGADADTAAKAVRDA
jgi:hypothetical protein